MKRSRAEKERRKAFRKKRNLHHLVPKSRDGGYESWNLLLIKIYRHYALHILFGNRTLDEIIELLLRVKHAKESQRFRGYL